MASVVGVIKGHTRSLEYGSYNRHGVSYCVRSPADV